MSAKQFTNFPQGFYKYGQHSSLILGDLKISSISGFTAKRLKLTFAVKLKAKDIRMDHFDENIFSLTYLI